MCSLGICIPPLSVSSLPDVTTIHLHVMLDLSGWNLLEEQIYFLIRLTDGGR